MPRLMDTASLEGLHIDVNLHIHPALHASKAAKKSIVFMPVHQCDGCLYV